VNPSQKPISTSLWLRWERSCEKKPKTHEKRLEAVSSTGNAGYASYETASGIGQEHCLASKEKLSYQAAASSSSVSGSYWQSKDKPEEKQLELQLLLTTALRTTSF
jgi:hypothetical protein